MASSVELNSAVSYCDELTQQKAFKDLGASNGLQLQNNGKIKKIGAAVDAGRIPFERAVQSGIDFLIVHHGMFWSPIEPLTGSNFEKIKTAIDGNLAVYGCHLPLDAHPTLETMHCWLKN